MNPPSLEKYTPIYNIVIHCLQKGLKTSSVEGLLAVQWLRLCPSNATSTGSIPGWELKSHMLLHC